MDTITYVGLDVHKATVCVALSPGGELTPIWILDAGHEAMRDLVRARATAGRVLSKARQHLQSFLLPHEQTYRGVSAWALAYRRWLTTIDFADRAQQIMLRPGCRGPARPGDAANRVNTVPLCSPNFVAFVL